MMQLINHVQVTEKLPSQMKPVLGIDNVFISQTLILEPILHVPKLSSSLLSIQKLTHENHYSVIFS